MSAKATKWATKLTIPRRLKLTLVVLAGYADVNTNECYPGHELLADDLGVSLRTVRRNLATLEQMGLIERHHRQDKLGHRTSDLYRINVGVQPLEIENPIRPSVTGRDVIPSGQFAPSHPDNFVHPIRSPVTGVRRRTVSRTVSSNSQEGMRARFDEVWEAWPRASSDAPDKLFIDYRQAVEKCPSEDFLLGRLWLWIESYRTWSFPEEMQYVKEMANWFRDELWKAKPPPSRVQKLNMTERNIERANQMLAGKRTGREIEA